MFVAELILVSSSDSTTVDLSTRPSTLCVITDNDCKCIEYNIKSTVITLPLYTVIRIGFELPDYIYEEPQFEETIDESYVSPTGQPENGPVFLIKEDNVTSEQTFLVSIQVFLFYSFGADIGQDFHLRQPGQAGVHNVTFELFNATQQRIPFRFTLLPDTLFEGPEDFLAYLYPISSLPDGTEERFPTASLGLFCDVFVTIVDDDRKFQAHVVFFFIIR